MAGQIQTNLIGAAGGMNFFSNARMAVTGRPTEAMVDAVARAVGSSSTLEAQLTNTPMIPRETARKLASSASRRIGAWQAATGITKPMLGAWNVVTLTSLAFAGGEKLGRLGMQAMNTIREAALAIPRLDMGGDISSFQTGLAVTERQRAIQAIQGGMYNARMAIGSEAMYMHR